MALGFSKVNEVHGHPVEASKALCAACSARASGISGLGAPVNHEGSLVSSQASLGAAKDDNYLS